MCMFFAKNTFWVFKEADVVTLACFTWSTRDVVAMFASLMTTG